MKAQMAMDPTCRHIGNSSRRGNSFRIGIVGCGPRGLYCLQSLADELRRHHLKTMPAIMLFEPSRYPGAGTVYDPRQPNYLRMNFAAKHIDAWPRDGMADAERLSLIQWMKGSTTPPRGPNDFVPRAEVGRYLHDCFTQVVAELQQHANTEVIPARVSSVQGSDDGQWKVAAGGDQFQFDELALTVGHEGWRDSSNRLDSAVCEFIPTFPTSENLRPDRIPSRSHVAVRGFGLTWIDAALAMTEGRGGRFEQDGQKWTYLPSGREPKQLLPFSRTGRPMLAKPDESLFVQPRELEDIWAKGRDDLHAISQPIRRSELINSVWAAITEAAASALNRLSRGTLHPRPAAFVRAWFDGWCRVPMVAATTLGVLRQSHAVATGRANPDAAWALGAAWRNLYPALVRCVSHGGLDAKAWPQWHRIAIEMERLAFGPPAENVARILALVDADIVDLRFVTGRLLAAGSTYSISNGAEVIGIDHCVDAVLPSPLQPCSSGPIKSLLSSNTIDRLHGVQGIQVDQAGRPLNDQLLAAKGLAILGRVTEGCILGNDTLSRTLHDHPRRWATSVVEQIRSVEKNR